MSYVSISKPVNDRIVQASRESKNEIIGVLLGRLENETIIIEDSITGEFSSEPRRVTLPSTALAKIADQLVSGRIKGNIVGWYHSHIEDGLFFSEIDTGTQKKLQQFSSLITGMVVDANTGDVGYFRVDPQTGKAFRIADERVRIFRDPSEAIAPELRMRPAIRPTPTVEVRAQPPQVRQPTSRLIIVVVLIALIASIAIFSILLYRGPSAAATIAISPIPVTTAAIGSPIEIKANVSGPVRNVTLQYELVGASSFSELEMTSTISGQYDAVIPGEMVTGNILYYVEAVSTSGEPMRTPTYQIAVSDFAFQTNNVTLTVYRTNSASTQLNLLAINGFNQQVGFTATGAPQGMSITFSPSSVQPGTPVTMNIATESTTPNGTFQIEIAAGGQTVTHKIIGFITVADFDLQIAQSSQQISAGKTASYSLTLIVQRGFASPVAITVTGLPSGATYQTTMGGNTLPNGGPAAIAITIQISTTSLVLSGTYSFTITASGGGLVHSQEATLTVR